MATTTIYFAGGGTLEVALSPEDTLEAFSAKRFPESEGWAKLPTADRGDVHVRVESVAYVAARTGYASASWPGR